MSPQPRLFSTTIPVLALALFAARPAIPQSSKAFAFDDGQAVLKTYCQSCHQGKTPPGRFDVTHYSSPDSMVKEPQMGGRIYQRLHDGSMPPRGTPAPSAEQRDHFSGWLESTLRSS